MIIMIMAMDVVMPGGEGETTAVNGEGTAAGEMTGTIGIIERMMTGGSIMKMMMIEDQ